MREIPLTRGQVALVDDDDFDWLSAWHWFAFRAHRKHHPDTFYAVRKAGRDKFIFMHKAILSIGKGIKGDHINGNPLDNRRENLRIATSSQNTINRTVLLPNKSSMYRGVTLIRRTGKWRAQVKYGPKNYHLGDFLSQQEAADAYDHAAAELHGEFARLNFPIKQ